MRHARNLVRALALGALLLAMNAVPAGAQCAMCYTTAAAQDSGAIRALNLGILVLLIPPVAIMGGILLFAFRYRSTESPEEEPASPPPPLHRTLRWSVHPPRSPAPTPVLQPPAASEF